MRMRRSCCDKKERNKGAWSKQEDQKLLEYIRKHGEGCWRSLPEAAGLSRCGKSCRLRWINYLRPELKRGNFGDDEQDLIIKLHALLGNKWSLIAGRLPGRTDNEVKNYWNSHLRRKLVNMGVDPNNHRLISRNHNIHQIAVQNKNYSHSATSSSLHRGGVSDDGSYLMEDHEHGRVGSLPDLNLELSITPTNNINLISSSSSSSSTTTTTLLLFH